MQISPAQNKHHRIHGTASQDRGAPIETNKSLRSAVLPKLTTAREHRHLLKLSKCTREHVFQTLFNSEYSALPLMQRLFCILHVAAVVHQKHSRPLPTTPYRPMRTRARTEEPNQVESEPPGSVPCHREPNRELHSAADVQSCNRFVLIRNKRFQQKRGQSIL